MSTAAVMRHAINGQALPSLPPAKITHRTADKATPRRRQKRHVCCICEPRIGCADSEFRPTRAYVLARLCRPRKRSTAIGPMWGGKLKVLKACFAAASAVPNRASPVSTGPLARSSRRGARTLRRRWRPGRCRRRLLGRRL
jgi:hypothetical protein